MTMKFYQTITNWSIYIVQNSCIDVDQRMDMHQSNLRHIIWQDHSIKRISRKKWSFLEILLIVNNINFKSNYLESLPNITMQIKSGHLLKNLPVQGSSATVYNLLVINNLIPKWYTFSTLSNKIQWALNLK